MTDEAGETPDERSSRLRTAEHAHRAHAEVAASSFAPLVAMGTEILKAVALINGGAGAATVAFVAVVLRHDPRLARALVPALGAFGFGLVVAACATGWSYLSHASRARALAQRRPTWTAPFFAETGASLGASKRADLFERLAFGAVLVAIASAVAGFSVAGLAMLALGR